MTAPLTAADLDAAQKALDSLSAPYSLTMEQVGWKRLSGACMRWVGQPNEAGDRDILELRGTPDGSGVAIKTAILYGVSDPADNDFDEDEVAAALSAYAVHAAVLNLHALHVLHFAFGGAVAAMEAAQDVSISYSDDTPGKPKLAAVQP